MLPRGQFCAKHLSAFSLNPPHTIYHLYFMERSVSEKVSKMYSMGLRIWVQVSLAPKLGHLISMMH